MTTLTFAGVTVDIPRASHYPPYIQDVLADGSYEQDEVALIAEHLVGDERVLELGCGLGYVGTHAKKRYPGIAWFSVDADPAMCAAAAATHQRNRVQLPAPVNGIVVPGKADGWRDFYVREEFTTSSLLPQELPYSVISSVLQVPELSLPALVVEHGIDTLVLDIEGGETELFTDEVDLRPISGVLLELHPHFVGEAAVAAVDECITGAGLARVAYADKGTGGFVACYLRTA